MTLPPAPEETKPAAPLRRWRRTLLGALAAVLALALLRALWPGAAAPSGGTPARELGAASAPTDGGATATRALEGSVQDDQGKPLGEATIRVVPRAPSQGPMEALEARSDASGHFRLAGLPAETLTLEITRDGHESKEHSLRPDETEHVTFVLARQGELLVALRDSPGQPVEGTEIVITGPGLWPAQAARASAAGEHVFKGLPAGEYRVRARRGARIALGSEAVRVVPGARATTELVLVEGATLTGSVVDQQTKRALAGVRVSIQDLTPGLDALVVVSDARGLIEASGLWPGAVRVDAQLEGYASTTRDLVLPRPGRLELTLLGAATIAGLVVDARGEPVANARLSVTTRDGLPIDLAAERATASGQGELGVTSGPVPAIPLLESGELALGTLAAESDRAGRFRIEQLAPAALVLHVTHAGYVPERIVVDDLKPHSEKSDLRVVLRAAGRVVGRIVDARGRPLSAVYVAARMGEIERSALTNEQGEYALSDVLGEVQVEAQPDGHTTTHCQVVVEAQRDARCDLRVEAAVHELRVRVVDTYGIGLEGALVRTTATASTAALSTAASQLSRRDGTLIVRELPEPPYTLDVSLAGHVSVEDLRVTSADREVRVRLARAGTLAGFVVDSLGRAVPGAFVSTEDGVASGDTDAVGSFVIDGAPPAAQRLVAHHTRAGDGRSNEVRARAGERLDGIRIMLKGRYDGEAQADARAGESEPRRGAARESDEASEPKREEKSDYTLEQRGSVLVVTQVAEGGPAAKAGLRTGDMVTAVDGELALSPAHARGMLRSPPGRTATVRVLRSKRAVHLRYRRPGL